MNELAPSRSSEAVELRWLAVPEAETYRVSQRDREAGTHFTIYRGAVPRFAIPREAIEAGRRYDYRVEVMLPGAPDFVTLVPYVRRDPVPVDARRFEAPDPEEAVPAWRLLIRDDVLGREVLDLVSPTREFVIDVSEVNAAHSLRFRFYRWNWRAGLWEALTDYRKVPRTGVRFAPPAAGDSLLSDLGQSGGLSVRAPLLLDHFKDRLKRRGLYAHGAVVLFHVPPDYHGEAVLDCAAEADLEGELGWIYRHLPISELRFRVLTAAGGPVERTDDERMFEVAEIVEEWLRAIVRGSGYENLPRQLRYLTRHDDNERNRDVLLDHLLFWAVPQAMGERPRTTDFLDIDDVYCELLQDDGGSRFVLEAVNYMRLFAVIGRYFVDRGLDQRDYFEPLVSPERAGEVLAMLRGLRLYRDDLVSTGIVEAKIISLHDREQAAHRFAAAVARDGAVFAGLRHDEGIATYLSLSYLRSRRELARQRKAAVLGSLVMLSPPPCWRPGELIFLHSCDVNFLQIYYPYWLSIAEYLKGRGFHFHFLLSGREEQVTEALAEARALQNDLAEFRGSKSIDYAANLSFSFAPVPDFCPKPVTFYSSSQYLFARTLSQRFEAPVIVEDVDLVFRDDPAPYFSAFPPTRISIWPSPGIYGLDAWRRFIAITLILPNDRKAHDSLIAFEDYIVSGLDLEKSWYLEQNALTYWFEVMTRARRSGEVDNLRRRDRPTKQERINWIFEREQIEKRRQRAARGVGAAA
ncbi:MAG: hypothetical protein JO267_08465 [Alphaproteobacteria bacterium]|nr:hypothetical protein [Alphaproteobacteria bacterium]